MFLPFWSQGTKSVRNAIFLSPGLKVLVIFLACLRRGLFEVKAKFAIKPPFIVISQPKSTERQANHLTNISMIFLRDFDLLN